MDLPQGVAPNHGVQFSREGTILADIAQETKEHPTLKELTDEELIDRVETILLDQIKEGKQRAYFQLGIFYYEQGNYEKAFNYFDRSKDFDSQSMYQLAVMLYDGLGCAPDTREGAGGPYKNKKKAVEYLKKIAMATTKQAKHLVPAARFNLGRAYFQGYGVTRQSDEEAEKWWLLAADDGNPKASVAAQSTLGMYYSREDSLDLKKAFFWHSEACGNGSLESQGALGVMYEYGIGVKHDSDSAYICLKEAADRGNVYAMGNLISHYYRRKLFTKAADLASKVSQLTNIELIAKETECLPDFVRKGIAMACFFFARCLASGLGCKIDKEEAKKYYSKSFQFDGSLCAKLQSQVQHGLI